MKKNSRYEIFGDLVVFKRLTYFSEKIYIRFYKKITFKNFKR